MSRRRERGVILLICLWLLAALALLALSLSYRIRLESRMVSHRLRRQEMLELARGAVAVATARIENSPREVTSYDQPWARPIALSEADFGDLGCPQLARYRVTALVCDELARLNINGAWRGQIRSAANVDDGVASAIIDWRDADDVISPMGAESAYYGSLEPARRVKSAPFESVYELLLVRAVTPEVFYGRAGAAADGALEGAEEPEVEGLRDLFTTYGQGLTNLNTAPWRVLATIPGVEPAMADNILYRRAGVDGVERTEDDVPFEKMDDLLFVGAMTEFARRQIAAYCVLRSDFFNVRVEAVDTMSSLKLRLDAVFARKESGVACISWRER